MVIFAANDGRTHAGVLRQQDGARISGHGPVDMKRWMPG